jgi:hypothetical protein
MEHEQDDDERRRNQQRCHREFRRVEERDHDDGAQVVEDGDAQQEGLQRRRHARAQERQHAEGERDVRRRRDGPAPQGAGVAAVEGDVDERGRRHAAQGGEGGQARPPQARQVALDDLALQLHADQEEEHGHQAVVDPQQQGLADPEVAQLHDKRQLEQAIVPGGERGIGDDHGQDGGGHEHHAAGRFQAQEVAERLQ